eukprot:SAG22_NODE_161_length_16908_cov_39.687965_3_plen_181_part_00
MLLYLTDVDAETFGGWTAFPCFTADGGTAAAASPDADVCATLHAGFEKGHRRLLAGETKQQARAKNGAVVGGSSSSGSWNGTAYRMLMSGACGASATMLRVRPVAGTAVIWNVSSSLTGEPLPATWHTACPLTSPVKRTTVQFFRAWPKPDVTDVPGYTRRLWVDQGWNTPILSGAMDEL